MSTIHMNFKQFGVLLSISTIFGINVIATKALAQDLPSITFGNAITTGGCSFADQLPGSAGRSLSISLDNISASQGQRQRCILRVNTLIPSGFRVQDIQILYKGSTKIGLQSKGTSLSRSYIFNGGALGQVVAPAKTTQFRTSNPFFQKQDNITVLSVSCGGQGQFGINIIAQSSPGSSIDISKIVIFPGKLLRC